MAKGVNKVILIGNLGNDPELKFMPSGKGVVDLSLATSSSWKDKEGVQQEHTEWHKVVFFDKLAEIVSKYARKGSKIYVEGSLKTNKWQDKDGNDRYTTSVVCKEMQLLDSKGESPIMESIEKKAGTKPVYPDHMTVDERLNDFEDDIPF